MRVAADGRAVVVPVEPPPTRPAGPITADTVTIGRRIVVAQPDGFHYDLRAITDPYRRPCDGRLAVQLVDEQVWYDARALRATATALAEHAREVPASIAWLERPDPT